ncbi:unnamed protein product [Brassicogethes aeneus]|uniref:RWD domain-containing protein n=1 Tax=Brassicogethes aeneus TaxID=1431903 RepID=A0A9P0FBL4_BRAAE|nr:unnamed protein product [Brassicogethes aeneus]
MDNIPQQSDEIEALKSIYDDQWVIEDIESTYSIEIDKNIKLYITLSPDYPSEKPPNYELLAPTLSAKQKDLVAEKFQEIYNDNKGEPIIFQWIEQLKEIAVQKESDESGSTKTDKLDILEEIESLKISTKLMDILHGPTVVDRKSVFQAHTCKVFSAQDVKDFMGLLLENRSIAKATHNISAYRVILPNNSILQDCDDDGESHAGGRLMHLLQILNAENVMVVVTRWYGGIQLGPDRFKHINNAARLAMLEAGFIKS